MSSFSSEPVHCSHIQQADLPKTSQQITLHIIVIIIIYPRQKKSLDNNNYTCLSCWSLRSFKCFYAG